MKILLLDFGSSFVKYSFYDNCERKNSEVFSLEFPKPIIDGDGCYEIECNAIDKILWRIMEETEANGCVAAFICVQMHGYIIKEQEKFSNYISWKDKRGQAYVSSYKETALFDNGTVVKANLPRVSLRTYPTLEGREFFTLGSYIAYILTGNNVTHITDACASGLFNVDTCTAENLFEGLSLPIALREIKPCGKYKNIDIYPPFGDHQISFLGASVLNDEAVLNLGTAAQVSMLVDEWTERFDEVEYRPYFLRDKRVATLSGISGADTGAIISRIKRSLEAFKKVGRILISGGGASYQGGILANELKKLGYKVELCYHNVGNEGLRRIADSVYSRRGMMLSEIEFVNFPFVMKKTGLDFFIIDNEHGIFENKTIATLAFNAKRANVQAIVRLPNNGREMITKLADGGVSGFLLPMTNEKKDIERVIEYAKYSPVGKRGVSTTRAHTEYGVSDIREYMRNANERMKIYAQIETRAGVEKLKEILSVSALDGVFIGPNDLSCDFDCMGDIESVKGLISTISKVCLEKGKPCGIITTDMALIRHALLCGCSMVSYGSEINMLIKGATVQEASDFSGFSSCSRFICAFKKVYGKTPLKYKKEK